MSLLDVLGNYYDSATSTVIKVPSEIKFTLNTRLASLNHGRILMKTVLVHKGKDYTVDSDMYGAGLLNTCNKVIPSFFVNSEIRERTLKPESSHENFKVQVITDTGDTLALNTTDKLDHNSFINKWLESQDSLPKQFSMSYSIVRTNNEPLRQQVSLKATDGKHPKDYFAKICDSSFDSSRTPRSKGAVQNTFPYGSIKRIILSHYTKEEGVFLAEYLYGVKVPKTATYEEFFKRLANRPQTDFGIKDVQVLKSLVNVIRGGIRPVRTTQQLMELGVNPITDLKRWYNKNPGLYEMISASKLA